jgi:hypothetical protein
MTLEGDERLTSAPWFLPDVAEFRRNVRIEVRYPSSMAEEKKKEFASLFC